MIRNLIVVCCFIFAIPIYSQNFPKQNIDFQAFVQNIIGIPADDQNYENLLESLNQLYASPLDLNKVTFAQLASLFVLTDSQINSFLAYRQSAGEIASIYELQVINDFDLNTIYKILPFVTVYSSGPTKKSLETSLANANHYFLIRNSNVLEQSKGFSPLSGNEKTRYLGSPGSVFMRYKVTHSNDISLGFTLEKDNGETLGWNTKKHQFGADFSSFHLFLQNKGKWKSIAIGDYTLQIGQGLVLASGFYLGKGAETILTVRRNSLGIRPYSSVIENNFFRGAAATYQIGGFEFTGFASRNRRSGNLVYDKKTKQKYVTSLDTDGYHRTQSELDDKAILVENSIGFSGKWQSKKDNFNVELTALNTQFSLPIIKLDRPYNKYEFSGSHQQLASLSFSYIVNNLNFFGETARSKSGGIGTVNGLLLSLSKKSDLSFVFRNYAKNFHSFLGNGFGENSRNINEKGAYIGYKFSPNRKWVSTTSFDYFMFPELKFGVDSASDGIEFLQRISHSPNKTTHWNLQYREQHKGKNLVDGEITSVSNTIKRNVLLNFDKPINEIWHIKTTIQGSSFKFAKQKNSYGFTFAQDARADFGKVSLLGRLAYFNTENYDNRQYIYEQDVLYAFSFPAYSGKGIRHYLMLGYKPNKTAELQLRWARTDLFNEKTIGSGLDEINKPHKSEIKFQVKWNW